MWDGSVIGFGFAVSGFLGIELVNVDIKVELVHFSSSEPSAHCSMPSHIFSLLIQAPYLHLNVYCAGHL